MNERPDFGFFILLALLAIVALGASVNIPRPAETSFIALGQRKWPYPNWDRVELLKTVYKRLAADLSINGQLVQGTRVELATSVLQTDGFPLTYPRVGRVRVRAASLPLTPAL